MLPQEAFPLRHEIVDTPPGPEHLQDKADSPHVSGSEADVASLAPVDSCFSLLSVSHALYDSRLPPDFFSVLVRDMLHFYAEQGDVQMAVSVLIILGERVRKDIDEQTQEHWYTSYIDLLQRFRLWNVSNEVVKLSTSRAVSCLNQASTTLHVNCSHCKRPMSSRGWVCDRWGSGVGSWGRGLQAAQEPPLRRPPSCPPPGATAALACVPSATTWSRVCSCGARAAATAATCSTS